MGEPVSGASELAAMAGRAFQKSNDKKLKKQQRNEAAASGGAARNGFRRTTGGATTGAPKRAAAAKKADADGEDGEGEDDDRAARAAAAANRKGESKKKSGGKAPRNQWMYIAFLLLICGGAVQVVVPLFESLFGGGSSSGSTPSAFAYPPVSHVQVDPYDTEQLRRVFFSGESWLVLCNNHTVGEPINVVFERAAAMLHHTEKAANAHHIFTAVLPCHEMLPSGKSILDRWEFPHPTVETVDMDDPRLPKSTKVNRDGSANEIKHTIPTAFYVSNGDKPQALAASYFGYRHKDDAITTTAHKMAEFVRTNTKPRALVTVTNSAHLTNYCTKRRHCALFLFQSDDYKMPAQVRTDINKLCGVYRALRCVALDVVRYKLSIAKALPAVAAGQPEWPRLVLTKKLTPEELKQLADETAAAATAAAAAAPALTPEEAAAKEAEESNPSRTVNPKARVLNSIGLMAKAHRGAFEHNAMSAFIETVLNVNPAWPTADEEPLKAASGKASAEDKKMTQLQGWPTVTSRPYSELPKKKKAPAKPKKPLTPEQKEEAAKKKAEAKAKEEERRKARAEAKAKAAANAGDPAAAAAAAAADAAAEKEARERMAREEADAMPQAADEDEGEAEAEAESAAAAEEEDEVDLDSADQPKI